MTSLIELKDRCARFLNELYPDVRLLPGGEGFRVPFEEFAIEVKVFEETDAEIVAWRNERDLPLTRINIMAWICRGLVPEPKLWEFLSVEMPRETSVQIGSSPSSPESADYSVYVYSTLGGDTLDPNELKFAVLNLYWDANTVGEALREKFNAKWNFED
jgi:hypothetical protein